MVNKKNHAKMAELFRLVNYNLIIYPEIYCHIRIDSSDLTDLSDPWALSGLLAKEAETRRNAFLAACRGPSQKLPARCSSELRFFFGPLGGIFEVEISGKS